MNAKNPTPAALPLNWLCPTCGMPDGAPHDASCVLSGIVDRSTPGEDPAPAKNEAAPGGPDYHKLYLQAVQQGHSLRCELDRLKFTGAESATLAELQAERDSNAGLRAEVERQRKLLEECLLAIKAHPWGLDHETIELARDIFIDRLTAALSLADGGGS
jgi:hypothetical protein